MTVLYSLLVFTFVVDSGSWVGIQNAGAIDFLFFGLACMTWFLKARKCKIKKRNFIVLLMTLGIFLLNLLFFINDKPVYSGYISYGLRLISTLIMCTSISYDDFITNYVPVLFGISAVSLVVYVLFSFFGAFIGVSEDGYYYMVFRVFRIYRNYSGSMYRNASIFWEPGAYQMFCNLAIAMILRRNRFSVSKDLKKIEWIYLAVFLICIITTFSTTGYLIACLMVGITSARYLKNTPRITMLVIGIPIIVGFGYLIYRMALSEVIMGKFSGKNTASFAIRNNDIKASIKMIISSPFLGYGFGTRGMWEQLRAAGRTTYTNSSGFLMAMSTFGIPFGVLYFKRILDFSKKYWKNGQLLFLILILFSGFTEGFCFYPVYFSILFEFRERKGKR